LLDIIFPKAKWSIFGLLPVLASRRPAARQPISETYRAPGYFELAGLPSAPPHFSPRSDLTSSEKSADHPVTNPLTRSASRRIAAVTLIHTAQTKGGALPDGSGIEWWRSCFEKLILSRILSSRSLLLMSQCEPIVIYYDGSDEAKCALARTNDLAMSRATDVHVLTVVDIKSAIAWGSGVLSEIAYRDMLDAAWCNVEEAVSQLRDNGIVAQGYVDHGSVIDCIGRHASLVNAKAIVVGYVNASPSKWWFGRKPALDELLMRAGGRSVIVVPVK
jgi:nucleotide-binding universal stress UspA family protein